MADGDTPSEGGKQEPGKEKEPQGTPATGAEGDVEAIAKQADKPDAVRNAIQAEREKAASADKELKKALSELKKYQDRDKSETEKLEERASTAEKDAAAARSELLRLRVAAKKNLDPDLADRLRGETEKELEADADRLLEKFKPQANGDVDAGRGDGAAGVSMNDLLRSR
jgi:hypothetical protein